VFRTPNRGSEMSYEKSYKLLAPALADADRLTEAWSLELMRISGLPEREPWEDVLLDLTEQLEPTMKKIRYDGELNEYDHTLLDVLQLLVLPNPSDPQSDRNKAVAMFVESNRRVQL
jgi:hypothetical protein